MLTAINKVRYYRKNGTSAYINWVHKNDYSTVDMTIARFNFLMRQPSRKSIDRELFLMLSVPTWVAAAEEVVAAAEEVVAVEVEEVTSTPSESPFNVNINYDSSTIRELQDICRERGLTIRGTKAEVVLRLRRKTTSAFVPRKTNRQKTKQKPPRKRLLKKSWMPPLKKRL